MRRVALAALLAASGCAGWLAWRTASALETLPPIVVQPNGLRLRYPADRLPVLRLPNGEVREVRSLLNIAGPMRYGDYRWDETGVPPGPRWIRVDLARQTLSLFRAGHEIGSAVILYGSDGTTTPTGVFPILERARRHRSTLYDADMPFMLRLTGDGVAIHASDVRYGRATHGCVGVPPAFAALMFDQVRRGDPVAIVAA